MQPPTKPQRRPAPDARGLPIARQDVVPGIPKQAPSPAAVSAAREAARGSSPEVVDVRLEALGHRVDMLEHRTADMATGQQRVVIAVDKLVTEVGEFKLAAVDSEAVKHREEHKTKRWVALIGLLTMVVAPAGTITANHLTKETPSAVPIVQKSAMQLELEACKEAPSEKAWAECIRDSAIRNAPARQR